MIIKGSQRGHGIQLARHLLNTHDNDHVEIHEIKGFWTEDKNEANLYKAFHTTHCLSSATQCSQYLFSVSLNPPQNESVPIAHFIDAINNIEQRLGLEAQPRAVVFHEKEGRRHAHCVWSRIDQKEIKAVPLPFYKNKLHEISRELYLKHEWEMPRGFIDQKYKNPQNFTFAEWQQAKRAGEDPRMLKTLFKQTWEGSDCRQAYIAALKEHGFTLARGDRRGYVAVDYKGEIYSVSKWSEVKTKDLKKRLGDPKDLPSTHEAKREISHMMTDVIHSFIHDLNKKKGRKFEPLERAVVIQRERHREERKTLENNQSVRWADEEEQRISRIPKGLFGLLSLFTGRLKRISRQNRAETLQYRERDKEEKQKLIEKQLKERGKLQEKIQSYRKEHTETMLELRQDFGRYMDMKEKNNNAEISFSYERSSSQTYGYSME